MQVALASRAGKTCSIVHVALQYAARLSGALWNIDGA